MYLGDPDIDFVSWPESQGVHGEKASNAETWNLRLSGASPPLAMQAIPCGGRHGSIRRWAESDMA